MGKDVKDNKIENNLVELVNIVKAFPGVLALNKISFKLKKGQVHVLLGENGAGKSTLIKILSGVYIPDEGEIYIEGEKIEFKNPIHARNCGIATIYQEFTLVEQLSVAENIFMGRLPVSRKIGKYVSWKKLYRETEKLLNEIGLKLNPKELVCNLGVAQKQMVEIAKAVSLNSKIIIMDEPTSVLTDEEVKELFNIIHKLKKAGKGIIYISHRLEEASIIGDIVTVLRNGTYIDTIKAKGTEVATLIKMMIGRDLTEMFPKRKKIKFGEKALEVNNLTNCNVEDINFYVKKGEVLGIAGLVGSGRTELARAIFGVDDVSKGEILINGEKVNIKNPLEAIKNGLSYISEERRKDGLVLVLSVKDNITLSSFFKFSKRSVVNHRKQEELAQYYVNRLDIKTPHLNQKTLLISGGNQQKIVVSKWLCADSNIFIFDEPTRGIDVGTKVEIYNIINELVSKGAAIIMISSELPEILGMSDRVIVMSKGKISGEILKEEATQKKILNAAFKNV